MSSDSPAGGRSPVCIWNIPKFARLGIVKDSTNNVTYERYSMNGHMRLDCTGEVEHQYWNPLHFRYYTGALVQHSRFISSTGRPYFSCTSWSSEPSSADKVLCVCV